MKIIYEDVNLIDRENNTWHLKIYDKSKVNSFGELENYHSITRVFTQEELQQIETEQAKQQEIAELKTTIDNKRYLGDDVTAEQTRLRELLGL